MDLDHRNCEIIVHNIYKFIRPKAMDCLMQSWVDASKGCVKVEKVKKTPKVNWMAVRERARKWFNALLTQYTALAAAMEATLEELFTLSPQWKLARKDAITNTKSQQ